MDASVLDAIVEGYRTDPGVEAKRQLRMVAEVLGPSDWVHGHGDDAAVVALGDERALVAGELIYPPLVTADPYGAGVAAVVTNVNDIAAMGGRPVALVDALVGSAAVAEQVLRGLRDAAELYGVAVVGGHLTTSTDHTGVSAFILGQAGPRVLSSAAAAPGHHLLVAYCVEGQLRDDFPFFASVPARGRALGGDVAVLAELAGSELAVACKDISMGGLFGSLAMLLEPSGCGVDVDVSAIPCPVGIPVERWVRVFPTFGFLLAVEAAHVAACLAAFDARGLACARLGALDASGQLRVSAAGRSRVLADVGREGLIRPAPARERS